MVRMTTYIMHVGNKLINIDFDVVKKKIILLALNHHGRNFCKFLMTAFWSETHRYLNYITICIWRVRLLLNRAFESFYK